MSGAPDRALEGDQFGGGQDVGVGEAIVVPPLDRLHKIGIEANDRRPGGDAAVAKDEVLAEANPEFASLSDIRHWAVADLAAVQGVDAGPVGQVTQGDGHRKARAGKASLV